MNLFEIGTEVEVDIERVAHGGHCVGRAEGHVIFVRHTAPGERVRVAITKIGKAQRFFFADCIEVISPSSSRITPACSVAGQCGGCDFQHLDWDYQLALKTEVLREQLIRLGGLSSDDPVVVTAEVKRLPGDLSGLGWRSRVEYITDERGRVGMRKHSSHEVVPITRCEIAQPEIANDGITNNPWAPQVEVRAVRTSTGMKEVFVPELTTPFKITEKVAGTEYEVSSHGFWQAHRLAAETFVAEVSRMLGNIKGKHIVDLYAGAGLFTVALAKAVGPGGRIDACEGDAQAVRHLRNNVRKHVHVSVFLDPVAKWLRSTRTSVCDALVLDPPRDGAGRIVIERLCELKPATVIYVACDPAALARDVAILREKGYRIAEMSAWDAFPMTHHFETIVKLVR